jgi:hypothetical protein
MLARGREGTKLTGTGMPQKPAIKAGDMMPSFTFTEAELRIGPVSLIQPFMA